MNAFEHRSLFSRDHPEALDDLLAPLIAHIHPHDANAETALIVERITYLTTRGLDRDGRTEILTSFAIGSNTALVDDLLEGAVVDDDLYWAKLARVFLVSPRIAQHLFDWFHLRS